ncbi:surfeit locus protein 6 homolog [Diabrotica virgifera virgifera]|uniref:Ribosomal RNA-processing protein 14/surfeit locus protein 6 C-terminal domain-containing protein n=1 Tax=Diabrotica virgifera virgifera TaxID=50390 RepID=A0ABM5KAH2_DIAVI|nr:surfeit locus protein 6 homolog [Diabrotica virgifera virgifera]
MQLINEKLDIRKVEQCLRTENKFISELLKRSCIPERKDFDASDEEVETTTSKLPFDASNKKTSRAESLVELQQRLDAIKGKKKQTYKEKLTKKGLKNRLKKKTQQDQRNAEKKLQRAAQLTLKQEVKSENGEVKVETQEEVHKKPVFNKEDKIVYSKIDFDTLGRQKKVKKEKDPKKLLEKLEKQKENIEKLKESGNIEKAIEIKEKSQWKNALAKAEGQKVKDDPYLLAKSVKKQEQKQRSTKKKWEQRQQKVEKAKKDKQQKRTDNIAKRKKEKKTKKLKQAVKKGKVIPGY